MFSWVEAHLGDKRSMNPIGINGSTANTERFTASCSLCLPIC